eukprot:scaffold501443_cov19-Prasinocladus_malaysianus.AAC.1
MVLYRTIKELCLSTPWDGGWRRQHEWYELYQYSYGDQLWYSYSYGRGGRSLLEGHHESRQLYCCTVGRMRERRVVCTVYQ